MNINKNYVLRQVVGVWTLVPLGEALREFKGMLKLNETGAMLWQGLEAGKTPEELAQDLVKEFSISPDEARQDVDAFIENLRSNGCIED